MSNTVDVSNVHDMSPNNTRSYIYDVSHQTGNGIITPTQTLALYSNRWRYDGAGVAMTLGSKRFIFDYGRETAPRSISTKLIVSSEGTTMVGLGTTKDGIPS